MTTHPALACYCTWYMPVTLYKYYNLTHSRALHHSGLPWNVTSLSGRVLCAQARNRFGLERRQTRVCKESLETMPHVTSAASLAMDTCQSLFSNRRWNCSSIRTAPELSADLTRGICVLRHF